MATCGLKLPLEAQSGWRGWHGQASGKQEQGRRGASQMGGEEASLRGCHWGHRHELQRLKPPGTPTATSPGAGTRAPHQWGHSPGWRNFPLWAGRFQGYADPEHPHRTLGQEATGSWQEPGEDHGCGRGSEVTQTILGALRQKSNQAERRWSEGPKAQAWRWWPRRSELQEVITRLQSYVLSANCLSKRKARGTFLLEKNKVNSSLADNEIGDFQVFFS